MNLFRSFFQLVLGLYICIGQFGCKPNECSNPLPSKNDPVVWKYPRDYQSLATTNYCYENTIVQGFEDGMGKFKVVCIDKDSGLLKWENTDWAALNAPWDIQHTGLSDNILCLSSNEQLQAIDLEDGSTLWNISLLNGESPICIIDGWVYKATLEGANGKSSLYRYSLLNGQKEFLFSISKSIHGDNIYQPVLNMPVLWEENSKQQLILQNRSFGWGTNGEPRMDILAYDLGSDSITWYMKNLDSGSSSSRPAIDGNQVYFYGVWDVYSINPSNGSTIWTYNVGVSSGGDFNTANILVVDDYLMVKQENRLMTAVNKTTGDKVWHNDNTVSMPYLLTERNDTVWMASGGLYAINAKTGEELINWDNNGSGTWIFPILPDPNSGYIYTADEKFVYCLDPRMLN